MPSNYVLAGVETVLGFLTSFMNHYHKGKEEAFINSIDSFFKQTTNKFLHSYGQRFYGRKKYHLYNASEARLLKRVKDSGFFNSSEQFLDSGGFQISVGLLNREETERLISMYYGFLTEHLDLFNRAFILDIPPGPNCQIFDKFSQVYEMNSRSYQLAKDLPQEVKDKIIYIHHFRTPKLWEIYTSILDQEDTFNHFQYHGTGGIVANLGSDMHIPCIIYVLPMIPLINRAKKYGRKFLNFHILGGANFRELFFYEFLKLHVKKKHGIELNITFDSSGVFKNFLIGRHFFILDKKQTQVQKINLRTIFLDKRFEEEINMETKSLHCIKEMSDRFGLLELENNQIYDPNTGTFFKDVKIYNVLYSLYIYSEVEQMCKKIAPKIYKVYEAGKIDLFNFEIESITRKLNSNKITKKQTAKSNSLSKSLDMLTSLDEDHCKFLVEKFLAKDEFTDLQQEKVLGF